MKEIPMLLPSSSHPHDGPHSSAPGLSTGDVNSPDATVMMTPQPRHVPEDANTVVDLRVLDESTASDVLDRADHPTPRRSRKVHALAVGATIFLGSLGAVGLLAVDYARRAPAKNAPSARAPEAATTVVVAPVEILPAGRPLSLLGDVRPARQVTLYAKVSGYLKSVAFDKGDYVKEGQVLGILETPEADQQIRSAEADYGVKRRAANRMRALAATAVTSQSDLERVDGDLTMAGAELSRHRAVKDYATIRAPFAGTITGRFADSGALLQAATGSAATALPLAELSDLSRIKITVYIGENDAPLVRTGTPVTVVTDGQPRRRVEGTITRTTHALDARTRTLQAEIELDNTEGLFTAGESVHVQCVVAAPSGVAVPAAAVFLRQGKTSVMVARDGRAELRTVETRDHDGKKVRVSSGLREGDFVILHAASEVSDGARIEAARTSEPPRK